MKRKVDDNILHEFTRIKQEYPAKVRLQHYVHQAEIRQETETKVFELQLIKELLAEAGQARRAIESQDLDHFAQAFERVIRRAIALKLPELEAALKKKHNAGQIKGGHSRHLPTDKIKDGPIKDDWTLWQTGKLCFDNTNRFAEYVIKKYDFPADLSTVRRWHREWCEERKKG